MKSETIKIESNHVLPAIASFFVIGSGQLIKGDFVKALAMFFGAVLLWVMMWVGGFVSIIAFIGTIALWLWNISDAYRVR